MQKKEQKFDLLCSLLIQENNKYNLTRIVDPDQIKLKHFEDSLTVLDMLNEYADSITHRPCLADIGSGAGFPGLALAIMLDNWDVVSVESTGKKAKFQKMAADKLELNNFTILNKRAEDVGHSKKYCEKFDVVTSRAMGHLAIIVEMAGGLLKNGGVMLAWKGPKVMEEYSQANEISKKVGMTYVREIPYKIGQGEEEMTQCRIVRYIKTSPCKPEYPRAFGIIKNQLKKADQ